MDTSNAEKLKDALGKRLNEMLDLFKKWDTDGNGSIDKSEFRKAVAALGGRGAWAPMMAKARAMMTPPEAMQLPIGVYVTPLIFIWHSRDHSTSQFQMAGTTAAVYAVLVSANYAKLKYENKRKAARQVDEAASSTKKKNPGAGAKEKKQK